LLCFSWFFSVFSGRSYILHGKWFSYFWAFDRNKDIKKYAINRILRLYPALYVCLAITIGLLVFFATTPLFENTEFYIWLIGQVSFLQFFTPESLRFWGWGT
jgi:peptidoglycan/LPS O-acetylase OafA/YrhL